MLRHQDHGEPGAAGDNNHSTVATNQTLRNESKGATAAAVGNTPAGTRIPPDPIRGITTASIDSGRGTGEGDDDKDGAGAAIVIAVVVGAVLVFGGIAAAVYRRRDANGPPVRHARAPRRDHGRVKQAKAVSNPVFSEDVDYSNVDDAPDFRAGGGIEVSAYAQNMAVVRRLHGP